MSSKYDTALLACALAFLYGGYLMRDPPPVSLHRCTPLMLAYAERDRWRADYFAVDGVNYALRDEHETVCDSRVDDLYEAMVSAELERGFEYWFPGDQLICDCVTGLIGAPEIGNGDASCDHVFRYVCREP